VKDKIFAREDRLCDISTHQILRPGRKYCDSRLISKEGLRKPGPKIDSGPLHSYRVFLQFLSDACSEYAVEKEF
jgi:hypothetical protein